MNLCDKSVDKKHKYECKMEVNDDCVMKSFQLGFVGFASMKVHFEFVIHVFEECFNIYDLCN